MVRVGQDNGRRQLGAAAARHATKPGDCGHELRSCPPGQSQHQFRLYSIAVERGTGERK